MRLVTLALLAVVATGATVAAVNVMDWINAARDQREAQDRASMDAMAAAAMKVDEPQREAEAQAAMAAQVDSFNAARVARERAALTDLQAQSRIEAESAQREQDVRSLARDEIRKDRLARDPAN